MKPADYTYYTYFLIFRRLKRVGSVLSRWELDPFLYIWYHTVRTQSGLSPCGDTHNTQYTSVGVDVTSNRLVYDELVSFILVARGVL